jgi:hypothetical protein
MQENICDENLSRNAREMKNVWTTENFGGLNLLLQNTIGSNSLSENN